MKHTASLTQGNILQVLLRFSIPFLLANLLQALYGAADLMIIGAYCPAESIAAVSTGTQVTPVSYTHLEAACRRYCHAEES